MTKRKPKAANPPVTPERDVLRQVVEAAAVFGIHLERRNVGMAMNASGRPVRFGSKGESDLYATLPDGRRWEVEVKRKGRKPTREQIDFLNRTNASGNVGMWVDDPIQITETLPKLLAGWRVELDPRGYPWRVSGDEPARPAERGLT